MCNERKIGIYCIENLVNSKKYIGQSIDVFSRWKSHKCQLRNGKHTNSKLQNAWNKYGEVNFKFYIILEAAREKLDELEIYYISLYDTYKNGYNKDFGGNTNKVITPEMRKKLSDRMKNLTDDERRMRMLAQESRPIYQIDLNGNVICRWYGAREASRKLNISQSGILDCLQHRRWTNYGYIWIFVEEFDSFNINDYINRGTQKRKILQKTLNGDIVNIWDSANSAQSKGFDSSAIIKCCKKKSKSHKGYLWEYL